MSEIWGTGALAGLLAGFGETVLVSVGAVFLALNLGLAIALARTSGVAALRSAGWLYVDALRNVPPLVLLFLLYFGLPHAGISLGGVACGIVGLGMYNAAFVAEALRGGIQSVGRGQIDAAHSLGLRYPATMRLVVLPQALLVSTPAVVNAVISTIKGTALVSAIAVPDLIYQANVESTRTFEFLPIFAAVAAFYLLLIMPMTGIVSLVERRRRWTSA